MKSEPPPLLAPRTPLPLPRAEKKKSETSRCAQRRVGRVHGLLGVAKGSAQPRGENVHLGTGEEKRKRRREEERRKGKRKESHRPSRGVKPTGGIQHPKQQVRGKSRAKKHHRKNPIRKDVGQGMFSIFGPLGNFLEVPLRPFPRHIQGVALSCDRLKQRLATPQIGFWKNYMATAAWPLGRQHVLPGARLGFCSFGLPQIGGVTNGGLRGVWLTFLEIGQNRPFPPFSGGCEEHLGNPENRGKRPFFLRYPQFCLNPRLLNPHLRHSRSWIF